MLQETVVESWLATHVARSPIVRTMEESGRARGFPLVGPLVGQLLEQLGRSIGASSVFEMGSGYGYSAAWWARAVGPSGRVVHTDLSSDLSEESIGWMKKLGHSSVVDHRVGDGIELLAADGGTYDIVFIDIDKEHYPAAWKVACERVRRGGLVVTDNALWSGRVADPQAHDAATEGIRDYLRLASGDERFLTTVNPIRDGLAVSLRL